MRNIKQLGSGSDLIVPTWVYTESVIFSFFLLHMFVKSSIHSTEISLSVLQPIIHFKFRN